MKYVMLVFCIAVCLVGEKKLKKIYLYEAPKLVKKENLKNNSAYGVVDVKYDYEKLYKVYIDNTEELENKHFSKKINIKSQTNDYEYHLVFKHWFIGQLFKLVELHKRIETSWWPSSLSIVFPKKKKARMWTIKKYLLSESKSSWVGSNLEHLEMFIAFIDMGKGKTRLYLHMVIDAKGCREIEEVKTEIVKAAEKILELADLETGSK